MWPVIKGNPKWAEINKCGLQLTSTRMAATIKQFKNKTNNPFQKQGRDSMLRGVLIMFNFKRVNFGDIIIFRDK